MSYSDYIYLIRDWLVSSGVRVHFVNQIRDDTTEFIVGSFDNETNEIWVLSSLSAREALLTIAHEAGHWIGSAIHHYVEGSIRREQQAYVYGWKVLCLFGAPVTRTEWRRECRFALDAHNDDRNHSWISSPQPQQKMILIDQQAKDEYE